MKKLSENKTEHLENVVLYVDDLEKIISVFKEISDEVIVLIGGYQLDDLDEMKNLEEEVYNNVEILTYKPHVNLSIDKEKVFLGEFAGTLQTRGVFDKIKQILDERKRKLSWFFQSTLAGIILMPLVVLGVTLSREFENPLLALASLCLLILLLIWTASFLGLFNKNKIITKRRKELPSFWKRKKDDIILAIISAIIGGLVTLALMSILG